MPETVQVGRGRVANYADPEQESMFYGEAAERKGSGSDDDWRGPSRSTNEEALSHDDGIDEAAVQAKGNTEDIGGSSFGRMEGHPLMQHSDESETTEETHTAQLGPSNTIEGEDEGSALAARMHQFREPERSPSQITSPAHEQEMSEPYALEDPPELSPQSPNHTPVPLQKPVEMIDLALVMQTPLADTAGPTDQEFVERMFLPDTDLVTFPTEAGDSSNVATWLFGGNLVEPHSSISDYPEQARPISSTTTAVKPLVPRGQTVQKEPTMPELEEKEPPASFNQRQQPTKEERSKRTSAMIMSGAGVCSLFLALTYLADYQRKRKEGAARKLELSFGGSQYEVDSSSSKSMPLGGEDLSCNASDRRPCAMESVQYKRDHNGNSACNITSDPWSLEHIVLGNLEFTTHSPGGHHISENISSTTDLYRMRIANYVPQRNYTIYEDFEETDSRAFGGMFKDGERDEHMRTSVKKCDEDTSVEFQECLPRLSEAPASGAHEWAW